MKILFLSTKSPLPLNDGHSLRTFYLLKQLASENEIHLLSFVKFQREYKYISELKKICKTVKLFSVKENYSRIAFFKTTIKSLITKKPFVCYKYNTLEMKNAIKNALSSDIDLVHIDILPLAVYLDILLPRTVVLNEHNVESFLLQRRFRYEKNFFLSKFFLFQQKGLEKFERYVTQRVNMILACSENDKILLKCFAPQTPIRVIPNGVDVSFFHSVQISKREKNKIIFVGGLNWYPNKDGLLWFDKEVMPKILDKNPNISVEIIGYPDRIKFRYSDHFKMLGHVKDVRPYMERAMVFIVPLRIGGGTRLKILNAMAMESAIVSTSIGAEGLNISNGENILISDDPQEFADSILRLQNDLNLVRKIGKNARKFICKNYHWEIIGKKLNKIYNELINFD